MTITVHKRRLALPERDLPPQRKPKLCDLTQIPPGKVWPASEQFRPFLSNCDHFRLLLSDPEKVRTVRGVKGSSKPVAPSRGQSKLVKRRFLHTAHPSPPPDEYGPVQTPIDAKQDPRT